MYFVSFVVCPFPWECASGVRVLAVHFVIHFFLEGGERYRGPHISHPRNRTVGTVGTNSTLTYWSAVQTVEGASSRREKHSGGLFRLW